MDLDRFRNYLVLLARVRLDRKIQAKLGASDIVQQTMLEAHQAIESFRGEDVAQLPHFGQNWTNFRSFRRRKSLIINQRVGEMAM